MGCERSNSDVGWGRSRACGLCGDFRWAGSCIEMKGRGECDRIRIQSEVENEVSSMSWLVVQKRCSLRFSSLGWTSGFGQLYVLP